MCSKDSKVQFSSYSKSGSSYLQTIIFGSSWSVLFFAFLFCIGFILLFPTETKATATYYQNNEMYLTGTLRYVGSSTGYEPVDNLDGRSLKIYLNGEAERNLAIDPYLTNMCTESVEGWIEAGYEISIPYSDRLHVTQSLYTNTSTRTGTAYYDVEVEEIQTNLLYRPDRNESYIKLIVCGLVLFSIWCVIKGVRNH